MRIISNFQDYYDTAAAFGLDMTIVYLRRTKEIKSEKLYHHTLIVDRKTGIEYTYNEGEIGFCGKFYPFVEVQHYKKGAFEKTIFWSFEDFDAWMDTVSPGWKWGYKRRHVSWKYRRFERHFVPTRNTEIFHIHQVPVLCKMRTGSLTLNPKLKDFEFYRIFDAYQAHQEVAMFVGGVLKQPENSMVEISNDDKIHKHGFNKYSFRNSKGGGPKRKRRKS